MFIVQFIVCILYTILYYIRGSYLCAAVVCLYRTYDLYYLVLRASSNFSAVYLYYFAALTQILRAPFSAESMEKSTASHRPPPLKSQWWRSCSGANGGAPVPLPANARPSHPCPTNVTSSPSIPSSPSVCSLQSLTSKHPSAQKPADTPVKSQWWRPRTAAL